MSDGITDAAKLTAEALRIFQLQYLKDIPTCYLVDELSKREGVAEHIIKPHQRMAIVVGDRRFVDEGRARILVVTD